LGFRCGFLGLLHLENHIWIPNLMLKKFQVQKKN
jgi:translation elongation factor EF-4